LDNVIVGTVGLWRLRHYTATLRDVRSGSDSGLILLLSEMSQRCPGPDMRSPPHRIRLEISSSNFPHYDRNLNDRNLNTGGPISSGEKMKRAKQSVYHDPQRLSRIVLPIMPQPLKTE
jgi:hypothetical protein